jgi:hypothetical protein
MGEIVDLIRHFEVLPVRERNVAHCVKSLPALSIGNKKLTFLLF